MVNDTFTSTTIGPATTMSNLEFQQAMPSGAKTTAGASGWRQMGRRSDTRGCPALTAKPYNITETARIAYCLSFNE
jgi:hypothetical protein